MVGIEEFEERGYKIIATSQINGQPIYLLASSELAERACIDFPCESYVWGLNDFQNFIEYNGLTAEIEYL